MSAKWRDGLVLLVLFLFLLSLYFLTLSAGIPFFIFIADNSNSFVKIWNLYRCLYSYMPVYGQNKCIWIWSWKWMCDLFAFADMDYCAPEPCLNNATCHDGLDNFTCSCVDGYTGRNCETGNAYKILLWNTFHIYLWILHASMRVDSSLGQFKQAIKKNRICHVHNIHLILSWPQMLLTMAVLTHVRKH